VSTPQRKVKGQRAAISETQKRVAERKTGGNPPVADAVKQVTANLGYAKLLQGSHRGLVDAVSQG